MLNEGWRRHERGTDVVVGLYETHGRPSTEDTYLEVIPRKPVEYRGSTFEESGRRRDPGAGPTSSSSTSSPTPTCPGSRNGAPAGRRGEPARRGQSPILDAEHPAPRIGQRRRGTHHGRQSSQETIPDVIVRQAEQVELVDMTPEAIRRRMAHGNIYPAERVDASLANYFRPGTLAATREDRAAALGRRPRRGESPAVPRGPRHRGHVGDARTC